jgi:FkbM family methyltransferase
VTVRSNLVFDVGMHKGEDTAFYLAKGFDVVAVEASGDLVRECAATFADEIESGRLTIVNAAIAPEPGPVTFYVNEHSPWGTTQKEWADRNAALGSPPAAAIVVEGTTFGDILERYGVPYYLKIDIEGADLLCLEALRGYNAVPAYVSIESDKRRWSALRREFDLLSELGYSRFKLVGQRSVVDQVPPSPALEGEYVPWRFALGASGLFGEEAPGAWLTRRAAMRRYRLIFVRYLLYGDLGLLRRRPRYRVARVALRWLRTAARAVLGKVDWYDTHAAR